MHTIDSKLAKGLQEAKSKECMFALIFRNATEGELIVSSKASVESMAAS